MVIVQDGLSSEESATSWTLDRAPLQGVGNLTCFVSILVCPPPQQTRSLV